MINHLSYSQISEYLTCQRAYKHKYIDGIKAESNDALLFGSAWHKMISMGLVVGGNFHGSFLSAFGDLENVALFDLGYEMLNQTHATLQGLKPARYEKYWSDDISSGISNHSYIDYYFEFSIPNVPVPIIGYIDMIANDKVPVDFKTANRKWSQQQADYSLQPTIYLAGLHAQGFLKAADFPAKFRYIIFLKKPPYDVQIIEATRTASDIITMFGLIADCYEAIEKEVFLPTGTGSWKCSENYCDFWARCKGGTRNE